MLIAIVLLVLILASLLFHWLSPWQALPLASNWQSMDDLLSITFVITGIFFVVLNLFLAYVIWRFRRRGSQASEPVAYQPVNHRLERWLTVITTVGIVLLLAPGLKVYADYIKPPADAMEVEVLGSQWQWRYRFPGADGRFGGTDARFVSPTNPFGLDPKDAAGQDDALVDASELHLPLNKPVKILLRAQDVLHDFYVPPFRARMNMVPGSITTFWFTPTQAGRFEAMCAQLCGVGHAAMRGLVVVEPEADFAAWLQAKPSFAQASNPPPVPAVAESGADPLQLGRSVAQSKACLACHSVDGSPSVGPSWKGLFGKTEKFADGSQQQLDEAALRREIVDPAAKQVAGFPPVMPKTELSEAEVEALLAYIRSLQ